MTPPRSTARASTKRNSRRPAAAGAAPCASTLQINVFDGTRRPLASATSVLYRVIDGNQRQVLAIEKKVPSLTVTGLTFFDNFGDNYTAIVFSDGYHQAGSLRSSFRPRFSRQWT